MTTLPPVLRTPGHAPPPGSARSGAPPALALAELALGGITVSAVLGLARLFEDGSFLVPVLTVTLAAHLLAGWCRRRHLGIAASAAIAVAGGAAVVSWVLLPETTAYGVPTTATLAEAGAQLVAAMATFREAVAPAPVEPGFVLAASVGAWVIAFVADTAAFRAGAVAEAAVPGATLFVFGAALGAPGQRGVTTALFLVAVLVYWLAQRALANAMSPTWLAHDGAAGSRALLRSGAALGAVVVAVAVVAGPHLPGARADALIPWRASERDGGSRVTISPLVDIQTRIVDQANAVVFTVTSPERSYWRLTALETFDGRIWSSNRSYGDASGTLEASTRLAEADAQRVIQEFEIGALSSIWLPVAYRPVTIRGTEASYDAESESLIVPEELAATQSGQRYTVESVLPRLTGEALEQVEAVAPEAIAEGYTALPEDFSLAVRNEALTLTAGAATQYAKALALQDHFRSGAFTYDLDVARGHDGDALETFLFETKTGYCEQFAGAFAAMARAAGLPARVAVGFTPGDPGLDGRFVVRGANGHAWPEVYLDGYGWVPFEPTPGRGIPGATEYTGVAEQQADRGDPSTATTLPSDDLPLPQEPPSGLPADVTALGLEALAPEGSAAVDTPSPWPGRLAAAGVVLLGLPAAWVVLVGVATLLRRWRRRRRATTPGARIAVAWAEVTEALAAVGAAPRAWETPSEVASRCAPTPGIDPALLTRLAASATTAAYGVEGPGDEAAAAARSAARSLVKGLRGVRRPRAHLRSAFDPRPLLPSTSGLRRIATGAPPEAPVLRRVH